MGRIKWSEGGSVQAVYDIEDEGGIAAAIFLILLQDDD